MNKNKPLTLSKKNINSPELQQALEFLEKNNKCKLNKKKIKKQIATRKKRIKRHKNVI